MRVVYLFYEGETLRVPFFDYDPGLFAKIGRAKLGRWDSGARQFILGREQGEALLRVLDGMPYVAVNPELPRPLSVGGFAFPADLPEEAGWTMPDWPGRAGEGRRPPPERGLFSEAWRERLETELRSRKYSPRTIAAYVQYNRFLCADAGKPPEEMQGRDVKAYMARTERELRYSASSMNLALSALKFFYREVAGRDIVADQARPRQDRRLPVVLSRSEIKALLEALRNPRHRLLLMMVYASGLRVSEVVALRREDLDPRRKTLTVRMGKGRKDRLTLLSEQVVAYLEDHYFDWDREGWIFPGAASGDHLSIRSAQRIFSEALSKAGIAKDASIHSLRHSFATHLLESGTNIRYIGELLGHASIRTTERYTHVTRTRISRVPSPLDEILGSGGRSNK
ncbi:MAG: tyrosine-type recombinase/integrase [Spirochaetaceae bacterium]|jgi:site-specific recombinase XerD|nr:tyrosine-type recombinase/integrase [Spirochaetaceae bacterium]